MFRAFLPAETAASDMIAASPCCAPLSKHSYTLFVSAVKKRIFYSFSKTALEQSCCSKTDHVHAMMRGFFSIIRSICCIWEWFFCIYTWSWLWLLFLLLWRAPPSAGRWRLRCWWTRTGRRWRWMLRWSLICASLLFCTHGWGSTTPLWARWRRTPTVAVSIIILFYHSVISFVLDECCNYFPI